METVLTMHVINNQGKVNKNKISSLCVISILLDITELLRADTPKFSATLLYLVYLLFKVG